MNRRLHNHCERKKALLAQSNGLLDAASKEDRDLTEDEQTTFDENTVELESLAKQIAREESLSSYAIEPTSAGFDLDPPPQITNPVDAFEKDPNKGFTTPREYLTSVMSATLSGHTDDDRLKFLSGRKNGFQATAGSDEAGTYSDPYGGFLVPSGFMPNLLQVGHDTDPTAGRTTKIPMATPKVEIPARVDKDHSSSVSGGLIVYRRSQTQTVTAARQSFEQVGLNSHPLMGLSYATEELLTDSVVSFAALIEQGFKSEFPAKILKEKLRGTGVGEMEGILSAPCLVSVTAETGQDADSIVYENVINMRSRCWGYQNAIWMYNQDCLPQLMQMVMVIGTSGVPVWQTSAREGEPDIFLGRPAFANENCSTVGDAGDLILGTWSEYLEGTHQPLQGEESMHVRFVNHERTFKFTMRNDGRCWWRTALTPAVSTTTLSPFVVLDART
jgi:HK97 family phage major capsid protein